MFLFAYYFHLIRSGLFFSILLRMKITKAILIGPAKATIPIKVFIAGSKTANKFVISNTFTLSYTNNVSRESGVIILKFLADLLIDIEFRCVFFYEGTLFKS